VKCDDVGRAVAHLSPSGPQHRADAIVVTGRVTGDSARTRSAGQGGALDCPVLVGGGLDASSAPACFASPPVGDEPEDGCFVDRARVLEVMAAARAAETPVRITGVGVAAWTATSTWADPGGAPELGQCPLALSGDTVSVVTATVEAW
jgi:hypothetical protein